MTTAEEILKSKPSIKSGLDDFYGRQTTISAMKQYALECIKADRIQAAENAKVTVQGEMTDGGFVDYYVVDKESIINCPIADLK